jgi:hypothetical protein
MSLSDVRTQDAGELWIDAFSTEDVEKVFPMRHEVNVRFTPAVVTRILNNIANCGVMYMAVAAEKLGYGQWAKLRKVYPDLEPLVEEAFGIYREKVAHAVHSRAICGTEEPVYYKGAVVGYIRKYSDRLLELHAKRHCPEYRDKSTMDVNVSGGVLVVGNTGNVDKEKWLQERRAKQIESKVIDND